MLGAGLFSLAAPASLPAGTGSLQVGNCLDAENFANTQYTVKVAIGTPPQYLKAVPDTGSFELLAASTKCSKTCGGGSHTLFNPNMSSTYASTGMATVLAYGQGEVGAALCNETIGLGTVKVSNQNFLMMLVNKLKDWDAASYDAVMGIGPLATVSMTDSRPALMTAMGLTVVGVCYGPSDGSPGRIDFGGGIPGVTYLSAPALGKQHWGVGLTKVHAMANGTDTEYGTCSQAPGCAAIVDSGTSLIAVPEAMLNDLSPILDSVESDCSNIASLPSIKLDAGDGHVFELPPSQWVIKMKDVKQVKEQQVGPFVLPYYTGKTEDECMPAFMSMSEQTDHGPMIILGAPFLRQYAVTFDRTNPENRTMGYYQVPDGSRLCAGCGSHSGAAADLHAKPSHALQPEGAPQVSEAARNEPMVVSMANLRYPQWLEQRRPKDGSVYKL